MKKNNKLPLYIALLALDAAITIFLLVISIIMLTKAAQHLSQDQIKALPGKDMITFFQKNPTVYGWTCVAPLIALFLVNIVVLILYVRKTANKEKVTVSDLSEEEKEALRQELLNDLQSKKE